MPRARNETGFTLMEILLIIVVLSILAAIGIPTYEEALLQARQARAVADLRLLDKAITTFEHDNGFLPDTLEDAFPDPPLDPWGMPYTYFKFPPGSRNNVKGARADKNLRRVNSSFDLYSAGEDMATALQFTALESRDDIVRAADGAYFGLAEGY